MKHCKSITIALTLALLGQAGTILLKDTFPADRQGTDGGPLWRIGSGEWTIAAEGFLGADCEAHFTAAGARAGRSEWRDYRLSLRLRLLSRGDDWRDGPWIAVRHHDAGNAYTVGFYSRMTALHKASNGQVTGDGSELGTSPVTITDDRWHDVTISVQGRRITVTLDGRSIIHATDDNWHDSPPLTAGAIVLCARRYSGHDTPTRVLFDDVAVEALSDVPDSLAYTVADARRENRPRVGLLNYLAERRRRTPPRVARKVLAFYYTWYGNPDVSGAWRHWEQVDAENQDIASSTHYPVRGAYDSQDTAVIDAHIEEARTAGLDGFICTWWGRNTFDDKAFVTVLERAAAAGFEATVYWETAPGKGREQIDNAVSDIGYLVTRYGDHPAFLKADGRPVIFVYGRVMHQVPLASWPEIITRVQQEFGDCVLVADGYSDAYARIFDGIHVYNIAGAVRNMPANGMRDVASRSFPRAVEIARRRGVLSCITIIPGYDDTKIRDPGLVAPRHNGQAYRIFWEEAIEARPDYVLITSWNEWHEGSEIEPSVEDGDMYLDLTRQYALRFRALAPYQADGQPPPPVSDAAARALQEALRNHAVAILPNPASEAAFWLLDAGAAVRELTWEEVVAAGRLTPENTPILLYAAGEHYTQTFHREHDVDAALLRYLDAGGVMVVISSQPFPFYYNESGESVANAATFGIPISGSRAFGRNDAVTGADINGWEDPPANTDLTFHLNTAFHLETGLLDGIPVAVPFPENGDQRWRPCVPTGAAPGDAYLALARLLGTDKTHRGDGIVCVDRGRGGTVIYAWHRMMDILPRDELLLALFRIAADRARVSERQ